MSLQHIHLRIQGWFKEVIKWVILELVQGRVIILIIEAIGVILILLIPILKPLVPIITPPIQLILTPLLLIIHSIEVHELLEPIPIPHRLLKLVLQRELGPLLQVRESIII